MQHNSRASVRPSVAPVCSQLCKLSNGAVRPCRPAALRCCFKLVTAQSSECCCLLGASSAGVKSLSVIPCACRSCRCARGLLEDPLIKGLWLLTASDSQALTFLRFPVRTKGQLGVSQRGHHCGHVMLDEENKARVTKCHAR